MKPDSRYGEIERSDGAATLRFRRSLSQPQEKVWRAITESEHLRWWMPADMVGERQAGANLKMVFWPDLVESKGLDPDAGTATILTWDPPNVFAWQWHGSLIRFELTPTSTGGCLLDLAVELDSDDPDTIVDNAGGYHLWMDRLEALLDNGSTAPDRRRCSPGPREPLSGSGWFDITPLACRTANPDEGEPNPIWNPPTTNI